MAHQNRTSYDSQRGDTLIEVLLGMVVLSIIIVGATMLMNSGLRSSMNAVEHTQVRNIIASQSELLRYVRDTYDPTNNTAISQLWRRIAEPANGYSTTATASSVNVCTPPSSKKAFYLTSTAGDPAQQAQIQLQDYTGSAAADNRAYAIPGRGMWIEAVASTGASPAYIDFHMRSCWIGLGSTTNQQVNSITRLYVP